MLSSLIKVDLNSNKLRVCYQRIRIFLKPSLSNFRKPKRSLLRLFKFRAYKNNVYIHVKGES